MTEPKKRRNTRGDGAIFQRSSDGLWVKIIELPPDPLTLKRKRKTITGKTRKIVADKVKAWEGKNDTGKGNSREYTVSEWLDFWLENYAARTMTPAGFRGYMSQAKVVKNAIGTRKMDAIDVEDIVNLHTYLLTVKHLKSSYVTTIHHMLSKAFGDAVVAKRAPHNPCKSVPPPGREKAELEVLEVPQAKMILANEVMQQRNGSAWAMALLTGARRGEILGLTWDRVDFENGTLDLSWQLQRHNWSHGCAPFGQAPVCGYSMAFRCPERLIRHKQGWENVYLEDAFWLYSPKTNSGDRVISLVDPLRAILLRHRELTKNDPNPHNLVWTADPKRPRAGKGELYLDGKPVDPDKHSRYWHDAQDRAGIPRAQHTRGHDLRHTAVTLLYDLEVPEDLIPEIVGHSAVSMSRKYVNRHRKRAAMSSRMIEAMRALGRELDFTDGNMLAMLETTSNTTIRVVEETADGRLVLEAAEDDDDQETEHPAAA